MDGSERDAAPARAGTVIDDMLAEVHDRLAPVKEGVVADWIPELAKASPEWFGISIATVDGQVYGVGDTDQPFSIQSVSKPFMYGYALRTYGAERVLRHVGVEPTGEAFNSIVLDLENNRPFNPMVNSGAIAVASLIPGETAEERRQNMLATFDRFAGRHLEVDAAVLASESATGHRNRAITYMMLNSGMVRNDADEILDLYLTQCAVGVTTRDLAVMAATLANDGTNPLSGAAVLGPIDVRDVLTVMASCGMYDYAGQWAFDAGMPAKSGVSGALIAVIPGQIGIGVFSPPLDGFGNSVRGVRACLEISRAFGLHIFTNRPSVGAVIRRELSGETIASERRRALAELADFEGQGRRTLILELQGALYFGSAERLLRRVEQLGDEVNSVIVDFHRVYQADAPASEFLRRMCAAAGASGRTVLLTGLGGALAGLRDAVGDLAAGGSVRVEADVDAALEWCEDRILAGLSEGADLSEFSLARLEIFQGLSREEYRLLESIVQPMTFDKGEVILREGDPARVFFVLARGSVRIALTVAGERMRRIAGIGPGMPFGEMALFDGGRRSANVIAEESVVCYGISVESLREISVTHPNIMATILANLARDLSERLRRANREIRALD